jgi:endonuclease VIII
MPEGDTIFRTARALTRALAGKAITEFRSNYALLTRYNDDTPLAGQMVERVEARGKWMLTYFSGGGILATHLLMSGSWHIYRPGEAWQVAARHMRIVIGNRDYQAVGFHVPVAQIHSAQSLKRDRRIPQREIDVLRAEFDVEAAVDRAMACAQEEIGDVLLHQEVLAGVGNVFKSEICFVNGVNPFCRVADLRRNEVAALASTAHRLIAANVLEDSPDRIVTYRGQQRRTTHRSDPGESLWVYGRRGEPCRKCGARIRSRMQGPEVRVTFWCGRCQPMPDLSVIDG